ncbi:hypothetical protein [Anaerolentibacter hominis]|uniref:hypothetical protein n=1 Tax=Anaerolentibacter hominis TaxID=3079009 RepID=UPI0031B8598B
MKKRIMTLCMAAMMVFASVSAIGTEASAAAYTCPNGNQACIDNGACLKKCSGHSTKKHHVKHSNHHNGHHKSHGGCY